MVAVSAVGASFQSNNSTEQLKTGILYRAKTAVGAAWKVTVLTVKEAGGQIGVLVFHIFEWFRPGLGAQSVMVLLSFRNIVQTVLHAREAAAMREEIANLREQNAALLTVQDQLKERNTFLVQQQQCSGQREGAVVEDRDALVKERNVLVEQNNRLTEEKERLAAECNAAQAALQTAEANHASVREELQQLQQSMPLLQQQAAATESDLKLSAAYQELLVQFEQLQRRPDALKTSLDDQVERVVPQLLKLLEADRALVFTLQESAKGEAAKAVLGDLHGRLGQLVQKVSDLLPTLVQHKNWSNLLLQQRVPAFLKHPIGA